MADTPMLNIRTLPPEIHLLILEHLPDLYSLQSAIGSKLICEVSPHQLRQLKSSIFQSELSEYKDSGTGRQCGRLFRELLIADREEFELAWPVFKERKMEELLIPAAIILARKYAESNRTGCAIDLIKRIWDQYPPFGWSLIPSGRTGGSALRFAWLRAERRRLERVPTLFPLGKCLLSLLAEDHQHFKFVQEELRLLSKGDNSLDLGSLPICFVGETMVSIFRPREYEHHEQLLVDGMFRYEAAAGDSSESYRWYNDPIVVRISNRHFIKPCDGLQERLKEYGL